MEGREVSVDRVREVTYLILPTELELETAVEDRTAVHCCTVNTECWVYSNAEEEVLGSLVEVVDCEVQTVVEETCVETEVDLL